MGKKKNYHKPRGQMTPYELEDAREKRRLYYRRARKRIAAQRKHRRATDPEWRQKENNRYQTCLLYTSPSPRDRQKSRMPSSA